MSLFHDILKNIQDRLGVSEYDMEKIRELLLVELKVPIRKDQVVVHKNVLVLTVSPLLRHEVQIKKEFLLSRLKENSFSFSDIQLRTQ